MNWRSFVNQDNAKRYVLPSGWDSKETIARQLECGEDRVRAILAPALRSKAVEEKVFPVWDATTNRVIRVTAFRKIEPTAPGQKKKTIYKGPLAACA